MMCAEPEGDRNIENHGAARFFNGNHRKKTLFKMTFIQAAWILVLCVSFCVSHCEYNKECLWPQRALFSKGGPHINR